MNKAAHSFSLPSRIRFALSLVAWLIFAWMKGLQPQAATWVEILLMASILILMPLARSLSGASRLSDCRSMEEFGVGLLLAPALLLPIPSVFGWLGPALWLIHRLWEAWRSAQEWRANPTFDAAALCRVSADLFPAIGAAWLLAYRLNWMPFGFDALIVLLTAAHFHHAGFTLPLMAGLAGKALPGRLSRHSCRLILAGVPLVAIGITCTHFKLLPWIEPLSVSVLVAGAFGVALLQMQMAFQPMRQPWVKGLFLLSGLSLLIAMLLALSFGLRSFLPQWALPMSSMWAIHGTLNTFGFGLGGIVGWRALALRAPPES